MNVEEAHGILSEKFGSAIVGMNAEATDPWVEVAPESIVEVATFLRDDERFDLKHLNDLCGVDYFEPDEKKAKKFDHEPHMEVVYNLSSVALKHRFKVKVSIPRGVEGDMPSVPTVSGVWHIADWHEREAYDMYGINFANHPNLVRILCPEDWVGHPLRKDYEFPLEYHGVRGQ